MTGVRTCVLAGFDDPRCRPDIWSELLRRGDTDSADLTWQWQRNWWETFGSGRLLLVSAELDGDVVAIAPLFSSGGMIFNLCPENHLDFVGDVSGPGVLEAILSMAIREVADFVGVRLYFVPDASRTAVRLREAAAHLGLACVDEGDIPSPVLEIPSNPEVARAATRKKSLVRHENYFRREGTLTARHWRSPDDVAPQLEEFFEQHVARRRATAQPSLFEDPRHRAYYRRVVANLGPTGWLRFTRIDWNGRPIAFHMGHCYRGRYSLGIPSFAIDLAAHSPGEVLLRQLILAAIEEGATSFDFGVGDEAYKRRFATSVPLLRTWGLYPQSAGPFLGGNA